MESPKWRRENPDDGRIRNQCGQGLADSGVPILQPLSFDEKIEKIQRYLPKGLASKILVQKNKIKVEHRPVTVMFCDMEGFTPLVEKVGSEKEYNPKNFNNN